MVPKSKPQIPRITVEQLLHTHNVAEAVALVGIRGYYLDTMGAPGVNDRGIYDDAIILIGPETFATYNANTDPSVARRGIAVLNTGLWRYRLGIHGLNKPKERQYEALVQAGKVTVTRDGVGLDTGLFGINIHRGGVNSTSSLGCQTIFPSQWPAFIASVKDALKRAGQSVVPYLLVNQSDVPTA